MNWIPLVTEFGHISLSYFWVPLGLWTFAAMPIYACSKFLGRRHPLIHYQGLLALILALPIGLLLMPVANQFVPESQIPLINDWVRGATPATTPLVETEFTASVQPSDGTGTTASPNAPRSTVPAFTQPTTAKLPLHPTKAVVVNIFFWLGTGTLLAFAFSVFSLLRLCINLIRLHSLKGDLVPATEHQNLLIELVESLQVRKSIFLAYSPADVPPMTFGWRNPVIAIPKSLEGDPQSLRTALIHELIHVRRNDFFLGSIEPLHYNTFCFPSWHLVDEQRAQLV